MPFPAPVLFASDFPVLYDCEWGFQLGGWGGTHKGAARSHVPVIFVHGNQADAENWYLVADYFRDHGGYTQQEMYALSYNGLGNFYAGAPTPAIQPAPETATYEQTAGGQGLCCSGGKGASDEPNAPDLYAFIQAVQSYTGSQDFDIVGHSLGVTILRRTLQLHPDLYQHARHVVIIAGANQGTTVCRGLDQSYYGCDEIAPGTGWLKKLNAGGAAVGPAKWMSIFNGTDNADPFFESYPGVFDDTQSPHLDGAINVTFPQTYHNDLRVRPDIVAVYLKFLQEQPLSLVQGANGNFQLPRPGLPRSGRA
jgi:pimeloyl-ACP methyl ester carboxylesterase